MGARQSSRILHHLKAKSKARKFDLILITINLLPSKITVETVNDDNIRTRSTIRNLKHDAVHLILRGYPSKSFQFSIQNVKI